MHVDRAGQLITWWVASHWEWHAFLRNTQADAPGIREDRREAGRRVCPRIECRYMHVSEDTAVSISRRHEHEGLEVAGAKEAA